MCRRESSFTSGGPEEIPAVLIGQIEPEEVYTSDRGNWPVVCSIHCDCDLSKHDSRSHFYAS